MKHPATRRLVLGVVALVASTGLAACSDGDVPARPGESVTAGRAVTPTETPTETPTGTSTVSTSPTPLPEGAIDPVSLPVGAPPATDHVVEGTLHVAGRSIETDLPPRARVSIMGSVGDLVVVAGQLPRDVGTRFWSVDPDGRARPLGKGPYESYTYPPAFVEETGHVWVHYSDRGTGRSTTWAIDVRTGEQLLELRNGEDPPPGLEPADLAVVEVLEGRVELARTPPATSPDGAWVATARGLGRSGEPRQAVVLRGSARAAGGGEVRTIVLAKGDELADLDERLGTCRAPRRRCSVFVGVGTPVWEDDTHVLVVVELVTQDTGYRRADVEEDLIVRCDLGGSCERASDLVTSASLGVDPGL